MTLPIDVAQGLEDAQSSVNSVPRIGHVHLKVADLDRSLAFYCGVLGFEVTQYLSRQLVLISAGAGYHHHIALNTRQSLNGSPPSSSCTGLDHFAILYPTRAGLIEALRRVMVADIKIEKATDYGISESVHVRDPDGNGVELSWDRPKDQWPRRERGELAAGARDLDIQALIGPVEATH